MNYPISLKENEAAKNPAVESEKTTEKSNTGENCYSVGVQEITSESILNSDIIILPEVSANISSNFIQETFDGGII